MNAREWKRRERRAREQGREAWKLWPKGDPYPLNPYRGLVKQLEKAWMVGWREAQREAA